MKPNGICALLCLALSVSGIPHVVSANGDMFFGAEEIAGQAEAVYFGSVRDTDGNYVDGATVAVKVPDPLSTYTAYTNVIGRYRTLDVGRSLLESGAKVDMTGFIVSVSKPGYRELRRFVRGRYGQNRGVMELNFVVIRDVPD